MDVVSDAITAIRTGRPYSARTVCSPPWGLRFPAASGAGFHVVFQGNCWMLPGDGAAPVALNAGDVLFVSHGQQISLADHPATQRFVEVRRDMDDAWTPLGRVDPAATVLICGAYQLDGASPHPLLAELPAVIHLPKRLGRRTPLAAVVELLGDELDRRRPGSDAVVSGLLDTMLLYILRTWYEDQAAERTTGWAAALADPEISIALLHIHRAPAHPWTVEALGRQAGLSRAAFARRFTALVGQSPLAYLTWWRLTSAGVLLRNGDTPLHAVAQKTGYTSEAAFNRAFKRQFGATPGDYRRTYGRSRRTAHSGAVRAG